MARIDPKPAVILEAIRDRLVARGVAGEHNVFIGHPQVDFRVAPGEAWVSVWFEGGGFDPEQIDGGTPTITGTVSITVWTDLTLDQAGWDRVVLNDASHGLLTVSDKIFQALYLHDLMLGSDEILRESLRPLTLGTPEGNQGGGEPSITSTWQVMFDWAVDEE